MNPHQRDPFTDFPSESDSVVYAVVYALVVTLSVAVLCGIAGYVWVRWLT